MFSPKRLLIAGGVAVVAVVSIVVAVLLGISSHTVSDHKSVKNEKFESIVEGMTAPDGLPPNGVFVSPASAENWYNIFPYVSRISYLGMPYEVVGENATYIVSISANGTNDDDALVVGSFKYPVMGIAYETERQADQAKDRAVAAMKAEPGLTDAKFFTKGSILYFVLQATFTDDQMSVENLPLSLTEDDMRSWGVGPGESYWYVSFGSFIESYKETLEDERYGEGVDKILAKAGITPDTYWVATSKDMKTWDGRFYNIDVSKIAPKDFMDYFNNFYRKVDANDENEWEYFSLNEVWPDQSEYRIEQAQSVLGEYTEVATKRGAAGSLDRPLPEDENSSEETDSSESNDEVPENKEEERGGPGENTTSLKKLSPDSDYFVTFKLDPNAWVGFLRGGPVLQAPRIFFIKAMTVDIKLNGEARLVVDSYTMDEYYAEVAEHENSEAVAAEQEKVNEAIASEEAADQ